MIPLVRELSKTPGCLILLRSLSIQKPSGLDGLDKSVEAFQSFYQSLPIVQSPQPDTLSLHLVLMPRIAASHKDMHLIRVDQTGILISAKSTDGFRYALATLKQLIHTAHYHHNGCIDYTQIVDYPALDYRGLHLDESRHFFGKATVIKLLDYMADLKLNHLHWHLTDDQGWRVESLLCPRLTEIAAWRREADGTRYGGYYTQEDIRFVTRYASDLGITIVPEFDLPGHSLALLAAYPELGCRQEDYSVANTWGVFEDVICVGRTESLAFLKALLTEMAELFEGPYFHIGGDEVPTSRWQACPYCTDKLKALGGSDYKHLQAWFTGQLLEHLKSLGKTVIAWDEVLDSPTDSSLVAMLWRGDAYDSALLAESGAHRYILCPNSICYLDWKADTDAPGAHGVSSLANVYSLDYRSYPAKELCMGVQANLWTEHMHNPGELFTMMHPRAVALAERAWNPEGTYPDFLIRLDELEDYFATLS